MMFALSQAEEAITDHDNNNVWGYLIDNWYICSFTSIFNESKPYRSVVPFSLRTQNNPLVNGSN